METQADAHVGRWTEQDRQTGRLVSAGRCQDPRRSAEAAGGGRGRGSEQGGAKSPRNKVARAGVTGWVGAPASENYCFETVNMHNMHVARVRVLRSHQRKKAEP